MLLLCMEVMTENCLILEFDKGVLSKKGEDWQLSMKRKMGHSFIEWRAKEIGFKKTELQLLHLKNFTRP